MVKITLTGNPLSTNHIYKHTSKPFPHTYMTAEGRIRKEEYAWEARSQCRKMLEGDLAIKITLYFGDKKRRDWDNFHKLSMDALTGIVWEDDSQIRRAEIILDYDKDNPRIKIEVEEIK